MKKLLFASTIVCLLLIGCSTQQAAQTAASVIQGVLNIAQAEEAALPPADAAILTPWVSLGDTLTGQLNTCITASGNTKSKLGTCFTAFSSGLLSPAELAQLRVMNPNSQSKVQLYVTAALVAVNGALAAYSQTQQPTPTIAAAATSQTDLNSLRAQLQQEGYVLP